MTPNNPNNPNKKPAETEKETLKEVFTEQETAEIEQQTKDEIMENLKLLHEQNIRQPIFKQYSGDKKDLLQKMLINAETDILRMLNYDDTLLFLLNEVYTAGKLAGIRYTLNQINPKPTTATEKETPPAETNQKEVSC